MYWGIPVGAKMYKNQLQELAQRSCFNLPSYTSFREGPDHAPRFKAAVNFNGETFESPSYCSTLRQAEHSAAEVALNALAGRGPSNSLAARILDETGVYKNLLQEVSQRVGAPLPSYTTFRSGLGHLPVFTCTVELAGVIFTGEPAKNKKQAEKNAALAAWLSLKSLVQQSEPLNEKTHKDEQEHVTVARALQKYLTKARLARLSFPIKFPTLNPRPSSTLQSPSTTSKILPFICPKTAHRSRPVTATNNSAAFQMVIKTTPSQPLVTAPNSSHSPVADSLKPQPQKFPAAGAAPYIPVRHCTPHNRVAPPVTIRNAIPVFSSPPLPHPQPSLVMRPPALGMAPPVCIRQHVPTFATPVMMDERPLIHAVIKVEDPRILKSTTARVEEAMPVSRTAPSRVQEPFSKLPPVRVEEPHGSKLAVSVALSSEVPKVQVDLLPSVSTVQTDSPASSKLPASLKPSSEEGAVSGMDQVLESAPIEGLKNLKI